MYSEALLAARRFITHLTSQGPHLVFVIPFTCTHFGFSGRQNAIKVLFPGPSDLALSHIFILSHLCLAPMLADGSYPTWQHHGRNLFGHFGAFREVSVGSARRSTRNTLAFGINKSSVLAIPHFS